MQRSSQSIASLAAALAKAQIELSNPEKSLIGSIEGKTPNAPERLFRYASLASGLDIVRKTLGQHEIATVQTTALDQASGIVNLTTVLAHASGEWIASDWPVCPISETATPHRMGAALTYARRYALFTLVGIAGEDDLDAPDLVAPTLQTKSPGPDRTRRPVAPRSVGSNGRLNADQRRVDHRTPVERPQKTSPVRDAVVLDTQLSSRLRDQMITELNELGSSDEAARWAKRRYPDKTKRLNEADAEHIDQCFRTKLLSFAAHDAEGAGIDTGGTSSEASTQPTDGVPRSQNSRNQSTRAPCRSRSRAGCGIATMSGMWLTNLAWSAAASPAMPTTFASRKAVHLAARSAMSSPSRCAAGIIVSSTATAMKPNGGARPLSIHSPLPGACGSRRIPDCDAIHLGGGTLV